MTVILLSTAYVNSLTHALDAKKDGDKHARTTLHELALVHHQFLH